MAINLSLTPAELSALIESLNETAMEMDDDGREGAFDASPLRPVLNKLQAARRAAKAG